MGDALRFLTRVEPLLLERRRNVWWTTWYFERELRAVAIAIWLSIFDRAQPIPHLGFEAAPWNVDTLAAKAIDSAYHMTRADSYRFATIVDAYTSCTKAPQVRLYLGELELYRSRQAAMHERLSKALRQLEHIVELRAGGSQKPIPEDSKADVSGQIREYIAEVVTRGRDICDRHRLSVAADIDRVVAICKERGGGSPWLFGDFGGADIMFAPIGTRFQTYGVELQGLAKNYFDRLLEHPLVVEWLRLGADESDVIPILEVGASR